MKSGLSYEQIQTIIAADAIDTIKNAKGGLRRNGSKIQAYFNYQIADATKLTGKRQVRVARQTGIDAKELLKKSYRKGGAARTRILTAFRNDILDDIRTIRGVQTDPTATLGEVCSSFIDYKLEVGNATGETGHGRGIRPTTASSMRKSLARLKGFAIFDTPLANVTPVQVQQVVNALCKTHSGASVQNTISVLRQASEWCLGARADLPTDGVVLPKISHVAWDKRTDEEDAVVDGRKAPRGRKNIVTRDRIGWLITLCSTLTGTLESTGTAAILAVSCGLREGECCALRWSDVHLDAEEPYIRVEHSLNLTTDSEGHDHYAVGPCKSETSNRNVPIPPSVVAYLRKRRVATLESLLALDVPEDGVKPTIGQLFVCGDLLGNFRNTKAMSGSWRTYCKRHDIKGSAGTHLTLHQLRDSYASALVDDGVPVLRVSHLLGHATIDVTIRRYVSGNDRDCFSSIANHGDIFAVNREERDGTNG